MQIAPHVDAAHPDEHGAPAAQLGFHPYRPSPYVEGIAAPRRLPAMPKRQLAGALALVALTDLAVWQGGDAALRGFGAALFFAGTPAVVLAAARARRWTPRVVALLALFVAVAARSAWVPTAGAVALGLAALFALGVALRFPRGSLVDVVASVGPTLVYVPRKIVELGRGARRAWGARARPAAVLVPLALVALFAAIFWLANPLVRHWSAAVTQHVHLPPPLRLCTWLLFLVGAVPFVRPSLARSAAPDTADETDEASDGAVGVARNALFALNVLFFGYNALDARYLWAGSPPPGVSERAYAHEGAAWLTIGILLLASVVGVLFRGALAHDARARVARALAFALLAQGGVVALGTFRRIFIHIGTSGLSSLRILGVVGTTLVVVGLVQIAIKLHRRRSFWWLLRRQADAAAIGLFLFTVAPTHLLSAPLNVRRVLAHDYQALVHAEEEVKEAESAAAMLPLLDHDDERIRRGAAALLLDERDRLRVQRDAAGLRGRALGVEGTLAALEAATPRLSAVLGDVDRAAAIVPFEYIRNSSIEGEIAQSEIDKVKPALSRPQKAVEEWAELGPGQWTGWTVPEVGPGVTFWPGTDEDHMEATAPILGKEGRRAAVGLTLARQHPGAAWRVTEWRWP